MSDRVFHRAEIGGLAFQAEVTADGPFLTVFERGGGGDGSALGVSDLMHFDPQEWGRREGLGWYVVKYGEQPNIFLPGFGDAEVKRMREEFGMVTTGDLRSNSEECFFRSAAWKGLVAWVAGHPRLAASHASDGSYLPGWYERALEEANRQGSP